MSVCEKHRKKNVQLVNRLSENEPCNGYCKAPPGEMSIIKYGIVLHYIDFISRCELANYNSYFF